MLYAAEMLWPGEAPGWRSDAEETVVVRDLEGSGHQRNRAIAGVTRPTMQAFMPPHEKATGMAVAVFPGGAHQHLAMDKEGWDVARWLNGLGIAAFVVKYRTGKPDEREWAAPAGVADAHRALQLIRSRAAAWGLNPRRIGAMGFSAGGLLTASVGTMWLDDQPDAADPAARVSSRPDFVAPVYSSFRDPRIGASVSAQTPPSFLVLAGDDPLPFEGSIKFVQAMRQAGARVEMHLYERGGHGFGLGVKGGAVATWPTLSELWVRWLA